MASGPWVRIIAGRLTRSLVEQRLQTALSSQRRTCISASVIATSGFGGAAIALVPVDDVSRVQVAVDGGFAEHGFGQPETFTVAASEGAARDA